MKEIETKIVDVDIRKLRANLKKAKARYLGRTFYRRYVFDLHPADVYADYSKWDYDNFIRLRTNGKKTTMTYKFRKGKGLANTEEIEVDVSDFAEAHKILSRMLEGNRPYYQENIVWRWMYKGAEIAILKWPPVPPYIEVEAPSEKVVRTAIKELGIDGKELGNTNLVEIFARAGHRGEDQGDLKFRKERTFK